MRSGSVEARLSRICGMSLLPYSVEVSIAIAALQKGQPPGEEDVNHEEVGILQGKASPD